MADYMADYKNYDIPNRISCSLTAKADNLDYIAPIQVCKFTPDGQFVLTAGDDRNIRLFNPHKINTNDTTTNTHLSSSMYTSNNNHTISNTTNNTKIPQAFLIKSYAGSHGHAIYDISISNDNNQFISGGKDRTIFVWDVLTGKAVRRISAHNQPTNAVQMSHNSSIFYSGSDDSSVKVWDLRSSGGGGGGGGGRNQQPIQTMNTMSDSVTSIALKKDTYRYVYVCVCMYVCMCVCVCVYVYVYVYVCVLYCYCIVILIIIIIFITAVVIVVCGVGVLMDVCIVMI